MPRKRNLYRVKYDTHDWFDGDKRTFSEHIHVVTHDTEKALQMAPYLIYDKGKNYDKLISAEIVVEDV